CDPLKSPTRVKVNGNTLEAFDRHGKPLWHRTYAGGLTQAEVTDLDGDRCNEVVIAMGRRLSTLDDKGEVLWSADASSPLRAFPIGSLFRKASREVVALTVDAATSTSRLTIYDPDGRLITDFTYPGPLQHVTIDKPTARHAAKI